MHLVLYSKGDSQLHTVLVKGPGVSIDLFT